MVNRDRLPVTPELATATARCIELWLLHVHALTGLSITAQFDQLYHTEPKILTQGIIALTRVRPVFFCKRDASGRSATGPSEHYAAT